MTSMIKKVLKEVHPDTRISKNALSQLNFLLSHMSKKILAKAYFLTKYNLGISSGKIMNENPSELTTNDMLIATMFVLPGELAKHAVSEGKRGVNKEKILKKDKLIVPSNMAYSDDTLKFLKGVLEYLAAELLELGGNAARDNRQKTISIRHLTLAVVNDEELNKMFHMVDYQFVGGGVLPNIHSVLLPKKK